MHAAVTFPQDHAALFQGRFGVAAKFQRIGIPDRHLVFADVHAQRRVASQMLIGKKENSLAALECPFQNRTRVAAGANDAAMFSAERF